MFRRGACVFAAVCVWQHAVAFSPYAAQVGLRSKPSLDAISALSGSRRCKSRTMMAHRAQDGSADRDAPPSQKRRHALQVGLLASALPAAAGAIDMNNAAGLRPDANADLSGLDLEGIGSGSTDRGDKKAFERKMRAKQQGTKAPVDRRASTKAERAAQSALAVFEDDTLGYAFALGPKWEAASQQLDNGGQIIAFSNKEKPDKTSRIVLVAQPSPVPSFDALQQAIQPQGKVLKADTQEKASGKDDGYVRVFDYENGGNRYTTLFALRVKPLGSETNWLITLTTQTEAAQWQEYEKEFEAVVKSFRLLYPAPQVGLCVCVCVYVCVRARTPKP